MFPRNYLYATRLILQFSKGALAVELLKLLKPYLIYSQVYCRHESRKVTKWYRSDLVLQLVKWSDLLPVPVVLLCDICLMWRVLCVDSCTIASRARWWARRERLRATRCRSAGKRRSLSGSWIRTHPSWRRTSGTCRSWGTSWRDHMSGWVTTWSLLTLDAHHVEV
jgi:hypothetical protein